MIPYLLAAVGGYLLGDSMKESQSFADGGDVSWRNPKNIKVGDVVKLTPVGPKGKVVDIIESPAPFVSTAKIDWEDKKDRGLMYVTHIETFAEGGKTDMLEISDREIAEYVKDQHYGDHNYAKEFESGAKWYKQELKDRILLNNTYDANVEVEIESLNNDTLELEVEIEKYGTEKKYYFEYFVDHDERSYSLHAIYDENHKRLPKYEEKELEDDKILNSQIENSVMDAFERYADEKYESQRDYEDEEYADGGSIKSNSDDIQVGDLVMVNAEVARNEGVMFGTLKDVKGIVKQKSGSVYVVQKVDRKGNQVTGNKGYIGTFGRGVTKI